METRGQVGIWINKGGDTGEYNIKAYGATGDGTTDDTTSIQSAINAAVASGGYTYFPQGTYKVSSNLTINCESMFAKDAMLSIDSTKVITITSNIDAKAFQIFSGSGTVSFAGNYVETEVYPQWWGAVGDNSTNNTSALNACFTSAATGGIGVIFPKGVYRFDDTITIPSGIKMVDMRLCNMYYTAASSVYKSAIIVGDSTGTSYCANNIYKGLNVYRVTQSTWANEADIGIQLFNIINSVINFGQISRFCVGVQCIAKPITDTLRLFAYNRLEIGMIDTCYKHLELTTADDDGSGGGYINENMVIGGRFSGSSSASHNTKARYGIYVKSATGSSGNSINSNKFIGCCFEMGKDVTSGNAVGMYFGGYAGQNTYQDVRDEFNDYLVETADTAYSNNGTVAYNGTGSAIFDNTTYKGSHFIKNTRLIDVYNKELLFDSGDLSEKAMYVSATEVGVPAPMFLAVYTNSARASLLNKLDVTTNGLVYKSGTLLGVGIRIDTTNQKKFMLTHTATAASCPTIVAYDAAGALIDASESTYLNTLDPSSGTNAGSTYFAGGTTNTIYIAERTGPMYFNLLSTVKKIDIIYNLNWSNNTDIKNFQVWGLNVSGSCPILDVYSPVGAWGECQGTASPTKWWKAYTVGRKLWNSAPATGQPIGWTCVFALTTALNGGEPLGETVMAVDSSASVANSDIIGVTLDDGTIQWTTVNTVGSPTSITLTDALTGAAGDNNAVFVNRWIGFGVIL